VTRFVLPVHRQGGAPGIDRYQALFDSPEINRHRSSGTQGRKHQRARKRPHGGIVSSCTRLLVAGPPKGRELEELFAARNPGIFGTKPCWREIHFGLGRWRADGLIAAPPEADVVDHRCGHSFVCRDYNADRMGTLLSLAVDASTNPSRCHRRLWRCMARNNSLAITAISFSTQRDGAPRLQVR